MGGPGGLWIGDHSRVQNMSWQCIGGGELVPGASVEVAIGGFLSDALHGSRARRIRAAPAGSLSLEQRSCQSWKSSDKRARGPAVSLRSSLRDDRIITQGQTDVHIGDHFGDTFQHARNSDEQRPGREDGIPTLVAGQD